MLNLITMGRSHTHAHDNLHTHTHTLQRMAKKAGRSDEESPYFFQGRFATHDRCHTLARSRRHLFGNLSGLPFPVHGSLLYYEARREGLISNIFAFFIQSLHKERVRQARMSMRGLKETTGTHSYASTPGAASESCKSCVMHALPLYV